MPTLPSSPEPAPEAEAEAGPPGADPAGSGRPDAVATALVRSSCRALRPRRIQLADRFAAHLTAFGSPVSGAHAAELLEALLEGVCSGDDPAAVEAAWRRLGARPGIAGPVGADFTRMGRALVRAVRDLSRDDWSSTVSSAWTAFHVWMAQHLALGASQVPEGGQGGAAAPRGRVTTDWTYEDLLPARAGLDPRITPAPKPS